jgi:hypothetical protein
MAYIKSSEFIGKKYGHLTIIDVIVKNNHCYFQCKCDCGNPAIKDVRRGNLLTGRIQSCGCLYKLRTRSKVPENQFIFTDGYVTGFIEGVVKFFFDIEDYPLVCKYKWYLDKDGYVVCRKDNKACKLHRIIICDSLCKIDHINGNKTDNRKNNLRSVGNIENGINSKISINNRSGVKGVYWYQHNHKWGAKITINKKQIFLGLYDNKIDAIISRLLAEVEYFGDFAPQKELIQIYLRKEFEVK